MPGRGAVRGTEPVQKTLISGRGKTHEPVLATVDTLNLELLRRDFEKAGVEIVDPFTVA